MLIKLTLGKEYPYDVFSGRLMATKKIIPVDTRHPPTHEDEREEKYDGRYDN